MSIEAVNQAMIFTVDTVDVDTVDTVDVDTVDTVDVAVIATSVFSELSLLELWIKFGKTANRKYIPIREIVKSLGPKRAGCLTLFHSLTGCDQVLFFQVKERELRGKHGKTTHSCVIIQLRSLSKVE